MSAGTSALPVDLSELERRGERSEGLCYKKKTDYIEIEIGE